MLARAPWLQVVDRARLAGLARSEQQAVEAAPAIRGTIYDQTGVALAVSVQRTTIYADPARIEGARAVALAAHTIIDVNASTAPLRNRKTKSTTQRPPSSTSMKSGSDQPPRPLLQTPSVVPGNAIQSAAQTWSQDWRGRW
jgi:cell division protein FtsI/penicillin-binding protein 2